MKFNKKIVIGTWPLSGDYGYFPAQRVSSILEYAFLKKFNEFDTAPSYGNGFMEFMIGNIFNGEKKILVNTKFGNLPFEGKSFKIDDLKKSLDQSLKRLRLEKINILFLHNPRIGIDNYKEIIKLMNSLKKNKIIRFSGISLAKNSIYEEKILKQFDIVQDDANLLSVTFRKYKNFKIYGRSPYANGILTGSLMRKFSHDDHRSEWLNDRGRKKIINKSLIKLKNLSDINLKELAFFL